MSEDRKLQTLNEFGMKDALKSAAKTAGSFIARHAIKVPKLAKTIGVEAGKGVAVEAGFEASKEYREHKRLKAERAQLYHERQKLKDQKKKMGIEESIQVQPPVVLILKRKSIRLFPQGEKIALYRNDKLGVNFAVPYDDTKDARSDPVKKPEEIVGAVDTVSEVRIPKINSRNLGRIGRRLGYEFKKAGRSITPQEVSTALAIGTAVGTAYATNKIAKKIRDELQPQPKKVVNGVKVYESSANRIPPEIHYYKVSPKEYAKLGIKLGLAAGLGKVTYDLTKSIIARKNEKHKTVKEGVIGQVAASAGKAITSQGVKGVAKGVAGHVAVGVGLDAASSAIAKRRAASKVITTEGLLSLVLKATKNPAWKGMGKELAGNFAFGGAIGAATAAASKRSPKKKVPVPTTEETLNEFIPALVAAGEAGAEALGTVGSRIAISTGENLAGHTIAKKILNKNKANTAANNAPVTTQQNTDSNNQQDEAYNNRPPHNSNVTTHKKFKIPKGLGKEVAKGAAVALGTVAVQKLFDMGYDAWRDKQDVKVAAKEARAKAKAQKEIAPRKIKIRKVEKPNSTVVTTKEIKENAYTARSLPAHVLNVAFTPRPMIPTAVKKALAIGTVGGLIYAGYHKPKRKYVKHRKHQMSESTAFEGLQKVAAGQHAKIKHDDKTSTHVDSYTAKAIMNIHHALSNENKMKLERMVNKDRGSFYKIADFAYKQHNKG